MELSLCRFLVNCLLDNMYKVFIYTTVLKRKGDLWLYRVGRKQQRTQSSHAANMMRVRGYLSICLDFLRLRMANFKK